MLKQRETNKKVLSVLATTIIASSTVLSPIGTYQANAAIADARANVQVQTTANLNVRESASTKSKALTVAKKGTKVSVISTSGNWYKVKVNGKTGWISKSYTKAVSTSKAATTSSNKQVQTITDLNVRESASTKSKILTVAKKGTKVSVISTSGNWYKVKVNGKTGWISKTQTKAVSASNTEAKATSTATPNTSATTASNSAKVIRTVETTADINLRSSGSTSGKILKTVKKGTKLEVVQDGTWLKVKNGNGFAYVSAKYTKNVTTSTPKPTPAPTPAPAKTYSLAEVKSAVGNISEWVTVYQSGSKVKVEVIRDVNKNYTSTGEMEKDVNTFASQVASKLKAKNIKYSQETSGRGANYRIEFTIN